MVPTDLSAMLPHQARTMESPHPLPTPAGLVVKKDRRAVRQRFRNPGAAVRSFQQGAAGLAE